MVVRGADAWHAPVGSRTMATATGTAPRTAAAGPPGSPAILLLQGGGSLAHGVENISEDLPGALRER